MLHALVSPLLLSLSDDKVGVGPADANQLFNTSDICITGSSVPLLYAGESIALAE